MERTIDGIRAARDRAATLELWDLVRILDMAILELAKAMSKSAEPDRQRDSEMPKN